jgi:hypothetical protein
MRGATPNRPAISLFCIPTAASSMIQLRYYTPTSVVRRHDSFSNSIRASELNSIAGATGISGHLIL